jgi:hypothetical protein
MNTKRTVRNPFMHPPAYPNSEQPVLQEPLSHGLSFVGVPRLSSALLSLTSTFFLLI